MSSFFFIYHPVADVDVLAAVEVNMGGATPIPIRPASNKQNPDIINIIIVVTKQKNQLLPKIRLLVDLYSFKMVEIYFIRTMELCKS